MPSTSMSPTANLRYEFPPGVAFQTLGVDQDGVMMSLASGYLYRCNRTAAVVLASLAAGKTLEEAAHELAATFQAPLERATTDAATLVADLCQRDLLRAAG
jgi:hypothetical protein